MSKVLDQLKNAPTQTAVGKELLSRMMLGKDTPIRPGDFITRNLDREFNESLFSPPRR
jgi:hypothetical protein